MPRPHEPPLLTAMHEALRPLLAAPQPIRLSRATDAFCAALEAVLQDNLVDRALFGTTWWWSYAEQLPACLPDGDRTITRVKVLPAVRSAMGRGRAFLRLSLNDGALVENLQALLWNAALTADYYRARALVRNHHVALLEGLAELTPLRFELPLDDPDLDTAAWASRGSVRLYGGAGRTMQPMHSPSLAPAAPAAGSTPTSFSTWLSDAEDAMARFREPSIDRDELSEKHTQLMNSATGAVQTLILESTGDAVTVLETNYPSVDRFCSVLESILCHGIRDSNRSYWPFFQQVHSCLPGMEPVLSRIARLEHVTSSLGRGRAFVRAALNDHALAEYLRALVWKPDLIHRFYDVTALLRHDDQVSVFVDLLDSIATIRFDLCVDDSDLDREDKWAGYWGSTPVASARRLTGPSMARSPASSVHSLPDAPAAAQSVAPTAAAAVPAAASPAAPAPIAVATTSKTRRKAKSKATVVAIGTQDAPDPGTFAPRKLSQPRSSSSAALPPKIPTPTAAVAAEMAAKKKIAEERRLWLSKPETSEPAPAQPQVTSPSDATTPNSESTESVVFVSPQTESPPAPPAQTLPVASDASTGDDAVVIDLPKSKDDEERLRELDDQRIRELLEREHKMQKEREQQQQQLKQERMRLEQERLREEELREAERLKERQALAEALARETKKLAHDDAPVEIHVDPPAAGDHYDESTIIEGVKVRRSGSVVVRFPSDDDATPTASAGEQRGRAATAGSDDWNLVNASANQSPKVSPAELPAGLGSQAKVVSSPALQAEDVVSFALPRKSTLVSQRNMCGTEGCSNPLVRKQKVLPSVDFFAQLSTRQCEYDGKFYCAQCHRNEESVIPAKVLQEWDARPYRVSHANKARIDSILASPSINVAQINPELYTKIKTLAAVRKVRSRLLSFKAFVMSCPNREYLLALLEDREYLLSDMHMYSLEDLVAVESGRFKATLDGIVAKLTEHISQQCQVCKGNGYFCEICRSQTLLFPFQDGNVQCPDCRALFHSKCFAAQSGSCPKCLRIRKIRSQSNS